MTTARQAGNPAAKGHCNKSQQRRIHRGHVHLLTEPGQRGMEKTAPRTEKATGQSERQAQSGRLNKVSRSAWTRVTQIVPAYGDAVEAHEDESQIGPSVGASAKDLVDIDPFRITGAAEFTTLAPAFPNVPVASGAGDHGQGQCHHYDCAPGQAVDPTWQASSATFITGGGGFRHPSQAGKKS